MRINTVIQCSFFILAAGFIMGWVGMFWYNDQVHVLYKQKTQPITYVLLHAHNMTFRYCERGCVQNDKIAQDIEWNENMSFKWFTVLFLSCVGLMIWTCTAKLCVENESRKRKI